jgi:hypothetical protein
VIGLFRDGQLYIELRPRCPKCKKEYMLDLKKFLPGKAHSCYGCGTITQFDSQMAEQVQKLLCELETSIRVVHKDISSDKTD